eukprot:jgi/Botrbrau1/19948/Bobra.0059s0065.1
MLDGDLGELLCVKWGDPCSDLLGGCVLRPVHLTGAEASSESGSDERDNFVFLGMIREAGSLGPVSSGLSASGRGRRLAATGRN